MAEINPEMIVLAREARGHSQADLAELIGISKGRMSKIEHGFLELPEGLLRSLSAALRYPEEFFYSRFQIFPAGLPFYRKHKTLTAKFQTKIVAQMNLYRKYINDLLREVEVTFRHLPECDLDEYGTPEKVAQSVRHFLNIPKGPVQNLTAILEDVGIVVVLLDTNTHKFSGASMLLENAHYIIFANANMPADRLRFTLAHELGHIVMHRFPTPDVENEADTFAREFLMPATEIKPSLTDLNLAKLASLKRFWRTSMGAILVHAQRLGMVQPRQYSYLWTQMGKAGYRTREPAEFDFPLDHPSLINEILTVHQAEMGYSEEEISRKLKMFREEFLQKFSSSSNPGLRLVK